MSDANYAQSAAEQQSDSGMKVQAAVGDSSTPAAAMQKAKTIRADPRMSELEKQNADLLRQLEEAKKLGGQQKSCCTIF